MMDLFGFARSAHINRFAVALVALGLAACGERGDAGLSAGDHALVQKTLQGIGEHAFGSRAFPTDDPYAGIIAYAKAQRGVDRDPSEISKNWGMKPEAFDAANSLKQASAQGRLQQWLDELPPPQPGYEALRQAYVRYLAIAKAGGWPQIPAGGRLSLTGDDPRVALLRQRLAVEDSAAQTASLSDALMRAQRRYGLPATGALDEPTRAALNVPINVRLTQIQANLQRWRWAPRTQAPDRIDVNIAAGVADAYLNNASSMHMRVAIGRPGDETPMLTSRVTSIVLNPTWTVPQSIVQRELLPKEDAAPGYLAAHGFTVQTNGDQRSLVQQPGEQNALGVVKFLFANKYGVYLHDTPAKAAFTQAQRSVSHGCVRLEKAVDLAKLLLAREPGWSAARVDQTIGGETTEVKLTKPLAVSTYYWTAWVENGQVNFRRDIYGWDYSTAQLANGFVIKPKSNTPPPPSAAPGSASESTNEQLAALEDDLTPSEVSPTATYDDYYQSEDDTDEPPLAGAPSSAPP